MTDGQLEDLLRLREQSVHGFGTNSERRAAWRNILKISKTYNPTVYLPEGHKDHSQVLRDVNRSFGYMNSEQAKLRKRKELEEVLMTVLVRNKDLHYYQGFHDIASTILTFTRESLAVRILEELATGPLYPYLRPDFTGLTSVLNFIFPLLRMIDKEMHDFLEANDIDSSVMCPYLLTYFTHNTGTLEEALRYLDFFISSHPLMPVYTVVSILHIKRRVLMAKGANTGTLMTQMTNLLVDVDVNTAIYDSVSLFSKFPPSKVLESDAKLAISVNCTFLNPDLVYEFPVKDTISRKLYTSHLDETPQNNLIRGIKYILNAAVIGMRMIFS